MHFEGAFEIEAQSDNGSRKDSHERTDQKASMYYYEVEVVVRLSCSVDVIDTIEVWIQNLHILRLWHVGKEGAVVVIIIMSTNGKLGIVGVDFLVRTNSPDKWLLGIGNVTGIVKNAFGVTSPLDDARHDAIFNGRRDQPGIDFAGLEKGWGIMSS